MGLLWLKIFETDEGQLEKDMFVKPESSHFYCMDINVFKKQAILYYSEITTPEKWLFQSGKKYRCTGLGLEIQMNSNHELNMLRKYMYF